MNSTTPVAIRTLQIGLAVMSLAFSMDGYDVAVATESETEVRGRRDSLPKRVLIVTGEDYAGHKWQQTTLVLAKQLNLDSRLSVDVLTDLTELRSRRLSDYDGVVLHFKNYDPKVPGYDGFRNLRGFVEHGGGLVLVHFACGAFEEFKGEAERAFLVHKLNENDWNVSETARKLAMPRSNLYKKIDKYGLQRH